MLSRVWQKGTCSCSSNGRVTQPFHTQSGKCLKDVYIPLIKAAPFLGVYAEKININVYKNEHGKMFVHCF